MNSLQITHLLYPITLFVFLVASAVGDYSMDKVDGEISYIWAIGKCVLVATESVFVLRMELVICWSTSHYQKDSFPVLGREMSNLSEMLLCFLCWYGLAVLFLVLD